MDSLDINGLVIGKVEHLDKSGFVIGKVELSAISPHCAFNENLSEKSYNSGFLCIFVKCWGVITWN